MTASFASTFHGAPRTTQDIDIVIDPDAASLDRGGGVVLHRQPVTGDDGVAALRAQLQATLAPLG